MAYNLIKSICDFSFGMLFMSQLVCTAAMYYKGRINDLQRMMFWFMLYLLLISVVEFCVFYIIIGDAPMSLTSPITDILEMTVVPCALFVLIRITNPLMKQSRCIVANAVTYYGLLVTYAITGNKIIYDITLYCTIAYSLIIIIYGFFAVRKFNEQLVANFSDEELSPYWLKYILYLYIGLMFIWTVATLYASEFMTIVYNISVMMLFCLFCYFVYRQEDMLSALNCIKAEENMKEKSNSHSYDFEDRFKKAFEKDEIYLNPKLNIEELSMAVGTNRTYISNYLNQQLHTTFYEYVNKWRVNRAKNLMTSTTLPLEEIATLSGFNSRTSFRRYFTTATGETPGAFRKLTKQEM
ncbi:MAG: helix-turn-helix domain-containing protein [Prevotella sp.]